MRTKHKTSKLIDPAAPWIRNEQIARLGDLAPHLAGRPAAIAGTWFTFWQTRKWFSEEDRKKHFAENWRTFCQYEEREEKQFQAEALLALIHGDHKFFSNIAEAIKHFAETQGKPVDPVRHAWITYCSDEEGIYVGPVNTRRKQANATVIQTDAQAPVEAGWLTIKKAREIAEQVTGRRWDNAEVRRGLKQCGLLKSNAKRRTTSKRKATIASKATPKPKPAARQPAAVLETVKTRQAHRRESSAQAQLIVLGVPRRLVYGGGLFWRRNDLDEVLELANTLRLALVRRWHSDKTGDETRLRQINAAWEQIEREFAAKGHTLKP